MDKFKMLSILPDKIYLNLIYYKHFHKLINFKNPTTFNEKLQWLKIYNRKNEYSTMVDKYAVKKYVSDKIREKYIIPTLGVWDNFDEIDFDTLPNQFVLKCTHDSGSVVICKDKSKLSIPDAKNKLSKGLKRNAYFYGREWPYKNVKPRIIAEKYMTDNDETDGFTDYKFFCFNGVVDCVMVCLDRYTSDTKFYFFDKEWNLKRLNKRGKAAPKDFTIPKPKCMDQMFNLAATLSKGIPFVRVDFYQSNEEIYFGELTFYPDSGFDVNILPEADRYFSNLIDLKGI